jgi:hypothetical protein
LSAELDSKVIRFDTARHGSSRKVTQDANDDTDDGRTRRCRYSRRRATSIRATRTIGRLARRALELEPENTDALLTMGHLLLQRGRTEEAREHALLVLHDNASHEGAIVLLAAVKARRSVFLGLWWRFNSFFGAGSLARRVVLLIGCYLVYRVAVLAVDDFGHPEAVARINIFWIGF